MPGILPMKVIKVGSSSQSRIAQACDRCRSKKIRCDGIRPTCSQCANVGFECRTSDKLSRRAFPRGYTESLEERVRVLEAEVRELKDLLDEKDEKIEMLSKMEANRHQRRTPGASPSASEASEPRRDSQTRDDTFRVQPTPLLLGVENSDSYFMGSSSGRCFIEALKRRMNETDRPCVDFSPDAFLHIQGCQPLVPTSVDQPLTPPPRIFSDRCVNVYFQEWAPLFPVLHKPTFLHVYEDFVADPENLKNNHKTAQLYLVFSIAGLASDLPDLEQLAICEKRWVRALDAVLVEDTVATLQCLILALLYCTMRADYKRLQHYKGVSVGLSHRLGLHQSQKRFSFGALTTETRKKVFWTLYTLDCFTAAILGLPKLLKEEDVQAEYPADTDDEYVTENGFQPTLPGECTRLSSALALFRGSRILAHVLEEIYPAVTPHELSLQQMSMLADELDGWYEKLPSHLRLNFSQDKPSTDITSSRSPLLALVYYHIRMLIYRPAVGSTLGSKAAPALLAIAESSKHIVQIVQLLEERNMTFAMCMNKGDVLAICGMIHLYHRLELKPESKLMRDNERLINVIAKLLCKSGASGFVEFRRAASTLVTLEEPLEKTPPPQPRVTSMAAPTSSRSLPSAPQPRHMSTPTSRLVGRQSWATASESDLLQQQQKLRRMTMPSMPGQRPQFQRSISRQSFENLPQDIFPGHQNAAPHASRASSGSSPSTARSGLDYMPLGNTHPQSHASSPAQTFAQAPSTVHVQNQRVAGAPVVRSLNMSDPEWEALLGEMDGGLNNVYDAIYGGPGFAQETPTSGTANSNSDWSPDTFDLSSFNLGDFEADQPPPRSVHSVSDDSISSQDEITATTMAQIINPVDFSSQLLAVDCSNPKNFILEGLQAFPV